MHKKTEQTKYILITGGVLSGLGKGVVASSTGLILKSLGFSVTSLKIDPYINIDAGTMSPFEHGEVYVLDDGGEVDLDLGNYERFIDITLTKENNLTTGKIYNHVIEKERRGDYLGRTVQVIPHITDAIQEWIEKISKITVDGTDRAPQFCIIELGGTVGDIESGPFIEAMRQFNMKVGKKNFCSIHVSLVPVVGSVGEQKSKPTQSSVRDLRALGLNPDILVCRCKDPVTDEIRSKIASFCNLKPACVISVHDVSNLFRVPLLLSSQSVPGIILRKFDLAKGSYLGDALQKHQKEALKSWIELADRQDKLNTLSRESQVHIAVVGKYTGLSDSYLSVIKALQHSALHVHRKLVIEWIESEMLEPEHRQTNKEKYDESWNKLKESDGILVPGGFGDRGIEGKILAAEYARTNGKPYLGVCLGMQIAVIEVARNILKLTDANSTEFDSKVKNNVVIFMPEGSKEKMGGTMRLGKRRTVFSRPESISQKLYGDAKFVDERHRHRYEVNPDFIDQLELAGLSFVGFDETKVRAEIVEFKDHPYFVGTQYHPEFKSRPLNPAPVFVGLLLAASGQLTTWLQDKQNKSET